MGVLPERSTRKLFTQCNVSCLNHGVFAYTKRVEEDKQPAVTERKGAADTVAHALGFLDIQVFPDCCADAKKVAEDKEQAARERKEAAEAKRKAAKEKRKAAAEKRKAATEARESEAAAAAEADAQRRAPAEATAAAAAVAERQDGDDLLGIDDDGRRKSAEEQAGGSGQITYETSPDVSAMPSCQSLTL